MSRHMIIVLLIVVALCVSVSATTIEVPGQYSSIQAGINASSNGDTVLVDSGTYVENINFNNRSIVLCSKYLTTGDTSYISSTIIDGNSAGSVVTIYSNEDSTTAIVGFTLQNGNATYGGGVYFDALGLTISNLVVKNNTASESGGGIYLSPAFSTLVVNVTDCEVRGNSSNSRGGGICCEYGVNCLLNVSHCLIENNTAFISGGGMYSSTASSITNSSFVNDSVLQVYNTYNAGGGFCGEGEVFNVDSSTFVGNWAYNGGAIEAYNIQSMVVSHCLVAGNTSVNFPGMGTYGTPTDSLVVANCTFTTNHTFGNGVLTLLSHSSVRSSIFSNNISDVTCGGIAFNAPVSISYCDIFNNQPANFIGSIPTGLGELIGENMNGDSCDAFQNILMDPLFCDTAIGKYELAETSPCLGAGESGSDIGALGIGCIAVDVDEDDHEGVLPSSFKLSQNYPNPFNPATTVEYDLPRRSHVTIEVYNVLGQKVQTLVDKEESVGSYSVTWDGKSESGRSVSTGVYFYRFQAGDHIETKKMLLLK